MVERSSLDDYLLNRVHGTDQHLLQMLHWGYIRECSRILFCSSSLLPSYIVRLSFRHNLGVIGSR